MRRFASLFGRRGVLAAAVVGILAMSLMKETAPARVRGAGAGLISAS